MIVIMFLYEISENGVDITELDVDILLSMIIQY